MLKRLSLLTLLVTSLVTVSCATKKPTEGAQVGGAEGQSLDSNVTSADAAGFDATGSDSGKITGLTSVNFDYDSANLSSDARRRLS